MTDQVSHPYKIRGNIIILCILIFMFLIQNGKTKAFWTEGSQAFPDFNALELLQGRAFVWPVSVIHKTSHNKTGNVCITYSECMFVALVTQHAKHMHRIICIVTCGLSGSTTVSHEWHNFQKKVTEHKTYVLIFSTTFVRNISHDKKNSVRYYHECTQVFMDSTCTSCQIVIELYFSQQILKNPNISKFMKIHPVEAELFHVDRQTWWS